MTDPRCLICGDPCDSSEKVIVNKPTRKGLLTIIESAEKRQDQLSANILAHKNSVLCGNTNLKFHVACRSSYISRSNIIEKETPQPSTSSVSKQIRTRNNQSFDIRQICLFCKKIGKKKREKLTSVQTDMYYIYISVFV